MYIKPVCSKVFIMQVSLLIFLAILGITTASTWQAAPYTLFREKRGEKEQAGIDVN